MFYLKFVVYEMLKISAVGTNIILYKKLKSRNYLLTVLIWAIKSKELEIGLKFKVKLS